MKYKLCLVCGIVFLAMALPAQATIIVIDDGDALGYATTGTWGAYNTNAVGGDYHFTQSDDCTATYTPSAIVEFVAGTYDVYGAWGVWENNASGATLTVNHTGGQQAYPIDNTKNAAQGASGSLGVINGGWGSGYRFLGTFDLDGSSNVVLSLPGAGSADAIMIRSPDEGRFLDQQSASFTTSDAALWNTVGSAITSPSGNYHFSKLHSEGLKGFWDVVSDSGLYNLKVSWIVHSLHSEAVSYLVDLDGNGVQDAGESLFTINQTLLADQLTGGTSVWSDYYDLGTFNLTDSSQVIQYRADDTAMTVNSMLVTAVPEPASLTLLVSALFGLLAYAWQRRK